MCSNPIPWKTLNKNSLVIMSNTITLYFHISIDTFWLNIPEHVTIDNINFTKQKIYDDLFIQSTFYEDFY